MGRINYFKPVPLIRLCFGCFLLLPIAALAPVGLRGAGMKTDIAPRPQEAQQTETYSFDWQAMEKAVGAIFTEKYGKEIIEFERQEIAALISMEKIDPYMEYFEKGLGTDIGMTIIEGEEYRWLENAEISGSQYRQVFKLGYNQGSLNASLGREADLKAEWKAFIKEWSKFIVDIELRKAEALMPKKKVKAYMKNFELGLNSDSGIGKKWKKSIPG